MVRYRNLRFTLVCLAMFLVGGLLRLQAGWLSLAWPVGTSGVFAAPNLDNEAMAALQATVVNFYTLVDKGRYQEAYQLGFETKWQKLESGAYASVGLVPVEEFAGTLSDEIGSNGMGLNIVSIGITSQAALAAEQWQAIDRPELQALSFVPAQVQNIYEVEVGGVLLGRCSRWDWRDRILVAYTSDGDWKLLLPGSLNSYGPHHEEWFLDRNPFKGKKIVPAGQGE